ncbi:MAG: tungsten formylmethanofuran dehydrogenase [Desulfuromonas sp.]|uniref:4Fe-4S dicluster domain-containing protein n=1 Tax=Desulfuromonas sp. TaxID=892 RepID=UPI000CBCEF60|nr:4Fe-4S dicluster domain-containing protein [Desulfuromonas sp.]PLX84734.1 MAG: tungsten formylmethanofuran dehydrogenase [Desulfuromonas sp.]
MPKIVIDEMRCKGCALCTIACPRGLIRLSEHINKQGFLPAVISEEDLAKCTSCALCAQMCPDVAICVFKEKKRA